jgi:hypothetical protein
MEQKESIYCPKVCFNSFVRGTPLFKLVFFFKVIFMDTLENTNDLKLKPQNHNKINNNSKKTLKVQISEDRIEHEITDKNQSDDNDDDQSPYYIKNASDTQTRNDLEELEEFYRRNLQQNTNLNTLTTQQNVDEMMKTLLGTSKQINNETITHEHVTDHSLFGLQAIHIRKELEEQTLNEVLRELTKNERYRSKGGEDRDLKKVNNTKFKHVKSTGYGKASWSPVRFQSPSNKGSNNLNESMQSSKTYLSIEMDETDKNSNNNNNNQDKVIQELLKRIKGLMEEREHDKVGLDQLKGLNFRGYF